MKNKNKRKLGLALGSGGARGMALLGALKALEAKKGRDFALGVIRDTLGDISFTSYPLSSARFETFRARLVKELE